MAKDICILCWKKEATEIFVQGRVRICKGCQYEVNRVLNFMAYFGYGMGPIDTELPPKPPTPREKVATKGRKGAKEGQEKEGKVTPIVEGRDGPLPDQPRLPGA